MQCAYQSLGVNEPNPRCSFCYCASCLDGDGLGDHHADAHTGLTSTVEKKCVVADLWLWVSMAGERLLRGEKKMLGGG